MSRLGNLVKNFKINSASTSLFGEVVGLDLGSLWCTIFLSDGSIVSVKNCLAIHEETGSVLAIDEEAAKALVRKKKGVKVIWPVHKGRISDVQAQALLLEIVRRDKLPPREQLFLSHPWQGQILVNHSLTPVQLQALKSLQASGSFSSLKFINRSLFLSNILQKWRTPLSPLMILDCGYSQANVAVVFDDSVVTYASQERGLDSLVKSVRDYVREAKSLLISEDLALKITKEMILTKASQTVVLGQRIETGYPETVKIARADLSELFTKFCQKLLMLMEQVIDVTSPDVLDQVYKQGVFLLGEAGLVPGLNEGVEELTGAKTYQTSDVRKTLGEGFEYLRQHPNLIVKVRYENR